tara:strand:- start:9146 stop:10012 length:867 start_codon:yes stop_codon:yes gene_type:complete
MFKWIKEWLNKWVIKPLRPWYPVIKVLEVLGVIVALVAFSIDFYLVKPRDRAIANASMYAQIASLDTEKPNSKPAMRAILKILIESGETIQGGSFPGVDFYQDDLDAVRMDNVNLTHAYFYEGTISDARLHYVNLSYANFNKTQFKDVYFFAAAPIGPLTIEDLKDREERTGRSPLLANYTSMSFIGNRFEDTKFVSADFAHTGFLNPIFDNTVIYTSFFEKTRFSRNFRGGMGDFDLEIHNSIFLDVDFTGVSLADMRQIQFKDCIFKNVKFPDGYQLSKSGGKLIS